MNTADKQGAHGDKTCNAHVFYFHNGEALLPGIWTDYEDQEDDLSAVYSSSEDFIWCQNDTACHGKDTKCQIIEMKLEMKWETLIRPVWYWEHESNQSLISHTFRY